jgi:DsbC/DsbD-like thiol-disulfide interchange protein
MKKDYPIRPAMKTQLIAAECHHILAMPRSRRIQWRSAAFEPKRPFMFARRLHADSVPARFGAVVVLGIAVASPALAADASPWDAGTRSAVRLIAGASTNDGGKKVLRGGIEIRLDPGWKTYWRYPGDSGVPPRFSFVRSENLESAEVLWPAPKRFGEPGDMSIGYMDDVILPLRVLPRDPARPVLLRFEVDYAICENLCIPAGGKAELLLGGDPSSHEDALRRSEQRVPEPVAIGEREGLAIEAVKREARAERPRVLVDVRVPEATKLDLFAEGPTPDWALPLPLPIPGGPAGLQRFAFELDGIPPGASEEGARLRLTAVADDRAIEVTAVPEGR